MIPIEPEERPKAALIIAGTWCAVVMVLWTLAEMVLWWKG